MILSDVRIYTYRYKVLVGVVKHMIIIAGRESSWSHAHQTTQIQLHCMFNTEQMVLPSACVHVFV